MAITAEEAARYQAAAGCAVTSEKARAEAALSRARHAEATVAAVRAPLERFRNNAAQQLHPGQAPQAAAVYRMLLEDCDRLLNRLELDAGRRVLGALHLAREALELVDAQGECPSCGLVASRDDHSEGCVVGRARRACAEVGCG